MPSSFLGMRLELQEVLYRHLSWSAKTSLGLGGLQSGKGRNASLRGSSAIPTRDRPFDS